MSANLQGDYSRFKKEIEKTNKVLFKIDAAIEPVFKKNHKSIYVLALLLAKLKDKEKEENKIAFFAEILSDFLTITKLAFNGFEIPSLILLRRIIENFYNHIYYSDHLVEYLHLNRGRNEYTPIEELKLYFESHPTFFDSKD